MKGELGCKLKEINIKGPYPNRAAGPANFFDLQLIDENGEFMFICGDNDIPKLLQDALKEYYKNKRMAKKNG